MSPLQGDTLALESLEDFKRKLDNEHTTVSAKLDQGVRARQELQELKGKLMEDLEVISMFGFLHKEKICFITILSLQRLVSCSMHALCPCAANAAARKRYYQGLDVIHGNETHGSSSLTQGVSSGANMCTKKKS